MAGVLSFDLSLSASGWAVGECGKVTSHGLILGKEDGVPRLLYLRNRVCEKIDSVKPDLIIFEDFSYGSSDGKAFERAGLAYMIRAEVYTDKIPYCACSPMSLKKFVVGTAGSAKQKVTKDLVIKEIFKRFAHDVNDNNVADAIGLAYLGMALLGEWTPQIEPQRQVMATMVKNHPHLKPVQSRQEETPSEVW